MADFLDYLGAAASGLSSGFSDFSRVAGQFGANEQRDLQNRELQDRLAAEEAAGFAAARANAGTVAQNLSGETAAQNLANIRALYANPAFRDALTRTGWSQADLGALQAQLGVVGATDALANAPEDLANKRFAAETARWDDLQQRAVNEAYAALSVRDFDTAAMKLNQLNIFQDKVVSVYDKQVSERQPDGTIRVVTRPFLAVMDDMAGAAEGADPRFVEVPLTKELLASFPALVTGHTPDAAAKAFGAPTQSPAALRANASALNTVGTGLRAIMNNPQIDATTRAAATKALMDLASGVSPSSLNLPPALQQALATAGSSSVTVTPPAAGATTRTRTPSSGGAPATSSGFGAISSGGLPTPATVPQEDPAKRDAADLKDYNHWAAAVKNAPNPEVKKFAEANLERVMQRITARQANPQPTFAPAGAPAGGFAPTPAQLAAILAGGAPPVAGDDSLDFPVAPATAPAIPVAPAPTVPSGPQSGFSVEQMMGNPFLSPSQMSGSPFAPYTGPVSPASTGPTRTPTEAYHESMRGVFDPVRGLFTPVPRPNSTAPSVPNWFVRLYQSNPEAAAKLAPHYAELYLQSVQRRTASSPARP